MVELMAALVLWAIISTAVVAALLQTGRATRQTTVRAERREMLRSAAALAAYELRGSAGSATTLRVSAHEVEYRARRWASVTCSWPVPTGSGLRLTVRDRPTLGDRPPATQRDSALVWVEGYPSDPDDGHWLALAVSDAGVGACPDATRAAVIELEPWPPSVPSAVLQPGAPVLGYERAALRVYRGGDGDYWLGLATSGPAGWNAVQPIAGPLAGTSGFSPRDDGLSVSIGLRSAGVESDSVEIVVAIRAHESSPP